MFSLLRSLFRAWRLERWTAIDIRKDPELAAATQAVRSGDLATGVRQLAATRADHERRAVELDVLRDAAVQHVDELARLADQQPDDADLALWLGATRIAHAWDVRSSKRASQVSREQFEQFWLLLGGAHAPLMRAAELLPDDPNPWDQLQWRGLGLQVGRPELDDVWHQLAERGPRFYGGHASRVQVLCGKWAGSTTEVLEFAEKAAANAGPGSPIAALPVAAHLEVAMDRDTFPNHFRDPDVQAQLTGLSDAWFEQAEPHIRTPEVHHLFGAALYMMRDYDRAARHLTRVDSRTLPAFLPWAYVNYVPGNDFLTVRRKLGLR